MSEMEYLDNLIEEEEASKLTKKKGNKKIRLIALISVGVAFLGLAIGGLCKAVSNKFKGNKEKLPSDKDSYTYLDNDKPSNIQDDLDSLTSDDIIEDIDNKLLTDLGVFEDENPITDDDIVTEKKEYQNPSNGLDKNKIVESEDGTLWESKEEKEEFESKQNEEVIDTKNGTLTVVPDENGEDIVIEKDKGYEVKDESGNVVDSGVNSNGVPDGFTLGDNGNYIKNEDVGKYVYSEYDFYSSDGKLIISKGDKMTVEDYEKAKRELLTEPPKTPTEDKTVTDTVIVPEVEERGVVNPDGTYTIDGLTFKSKSVYEDYLIHPELYGEYNGVIMLVSEILAPNSNEKSDVAVDNGYQNSNNSVDNGYQNDNSNNSNNVSSQTDEGVINPDGTYTIYGVTYKSEADYYNFIEHPELYGEYKGVMMLLTDMPYDIYDETDDTSNIYYLYDTNDSQYFDYSFDDGATSSVEEYGIDGAQKVLKLR